MRNYNSNSVSLPVSPSYPPFSATSLSCSPSPYPLTLSMDQFNRPNMVSFTDITIVLYHRLKRPYYTIFGFSFSCSVIYRFFVHVNSLQRLKSISFSPSLCLKRLHWTPWFSSVTYGPTDTTVHTDIHLNISRRGLFKVETLHTDIHLNISSIFPL